MEFREDEELALDTQLVNAMKPKIQDSSLLPLRISFSLPMITKITHRGLTDRRKVNPGFYGDGCFKNALLNVQVDLVRKSWGW